MTEPKEPRFFAWDDKYARGLEWYESLYDAAGDKRMRGEGSQSYSLSSLFPKTAPRLASYAPDLKLIYIVRQPLDRIESLWLEMRSWDYWRLRGFLRNAGASTSMVDSDFNAAVRHNPAFLESSNYWREINVYREHFPDDQILVLFLDDLKADQGAVLQRCWEFLGVDPAAPIEEGPSHMNRAAEKSFQGKAYSMLLKTPGFDTGYRVAKRVMPRRIMKAVDRRMLSNRSSARPEWDAELRRQVADQLRPDTETFLEFYGRSRDSWNLE